MKEPQVTKPTLNTQSALKFASEDDSEKAKYLIKTALIRPSVQKISFAPEGDRRLTINIKEELHLRLKHMAIDNNTTVGEIIERLVLNFIQDR